MAVTATLRNGLIRGNQIIENHGFSWFFPRISLLFVTFPLHSWYINPVVQHAEQLRGQSSRRVQQPADAETPRLTLGAE
jgi:hypothetical protein